jgi:site-specific DNA-methyltransferase (adenine-specific)
MPKYETETIYLADGIAGLLALPLGSADMLLTDPPYGTTQNYWDVPLPLPEFWAAVKRAVKPNGAILLFAQCPYDKILGASNLDMLRYEWVWRKDKATGFLNARRMPLKKSENILTFYQKLPTYNPQFGRGAPYFQKPRPHVSDNYGGGLVSGAGSPDGKRFPCNVIQFNTVHGGMHPTQKPVELCEYLIKTYTDAGELVVDICAGSGTTAVACMRTGRRFICFENAPRYFAAASGRIAREREKATKGRDD